MSLLTDLAGLSDGEAAEAHTWHRADGLDLAPKKTGSTKVERLQWPLGARQVVTPGSLPR